MNPIIQILQAAGPILDRFIPDPNKKAEFINQMASKEADYAHAIQAAQLEINKAEAAHRSMFVAGWRPGLAWICTAAFGCNYLILPLARIIAEFQGVPFNVQPLDMSEMMPVLMGVLGLGGYRSFEKSRGLAK